MRTSHTHHRPDLRHPHDRRRQHDGRRRQEPRRVLILAGGDAPSGRLAAAVETRGDLQPVAVLPAEVCLIDMGPGRPEAAARLARAALHAGIEPWVLHTSGDPRTALAVPDGARLVDRGEAVLQGRIGPAYPPAHARQRAVLMAVCAGARDAEDVAVRLGTDRRRVTAALVGARWRLGGHSLDEVIRRELRSTRGGDAGRGNARS